MSFALFPVETPEFAEIAPSLQMIVRQFADNAISQKNPYLVHMMAVPGAGKTSFVSVLAKRLSDTCPAVVAFDRIMEAIPEYQSESDKEKAFALWELPARAAGYVLIKNLLTKKANIIFDHSASFDAHVKILDYAKRCGYRVAMVRILIPLDVAKRRIELRQTEQQRHTPLCYVDERDEKLKQLLCAYKEAADFFAETTNNDAPPQVRSAFFEKTAEKVADFIFNKPAIR